MFKFYHSSKEEELLPNTQRVTVATVFLGDASYTGKAYCSTRDQFQKETGRKVAISKAISSLPRPVRTKIWKKYFESKIPVGLIAV